MNVIIYSSFLNKRINILKKYVLDMNIRYGNIFIFLLVLAMIGTLVTGSDVSLFPFTYFMFLLFFLISADYFYIVFQYSRRENINSSIKFGVLINIVFMALIVYAIFNSPPLEFLDFCSSLQKFIFFFFNAFSITINNK